MAIRRPKFQRQIGDNTTALDGFICTMTSGAMALDYQTRGAVVLTGGQLLGHSGLEDDDVTDNGTNLRDLERAWKSVSAKKKMPSIALQIRHNGFDDVLMALAKGRAVILQGDYRKLGKVNRCQESPEVPAHAILVLPERNGTSLLVADPLCKDFKFVPEADLKKFALALGSPSHVFHANTQVPIGDGAVAKKAPPAPVVDEHVNPRLHLPIAVCDVAATPIFTDPGGTSPFKKPFAGATNVGLYARPAAGAAKKFAAIRVDTEKGQKERLHVMWVPDDKISNVRLVG